jgi:hypothetical protein
MEDPLEAVKSANGRVQARALALTWSCPKDKEVNPIDLMGGKDNLLEKLKAQRFGNNQVECVLVAREMHENGKAHYHAYVKYTSRINVVNMRSWDFYDVHPNIKVVSDWRKWVRYVIKDGDIANDGVDIDAAQEMGKTEKSKAWADAMALVRVETNPN